MRIKTRSPAHNIEALKYLLIVLFSIGLAFCGLKIFFNKNNLKFGIKNYQNSNFVAAEKYFRSASKYSPDDPSVQIALANALYAQGKHEDALKIYEAIDEFSEPTVRIEALLNTASIFQIQNKLHEALKSLTELVQLSPGFTEAHYRMGVIYTLQKNWPAAAMCFRQVLQINPGSTLAEFQLKRIEDSMARTNTISQNRRIASLRESSPLVKKAKRQKTQKFTRRND
jgi:tetratricopeptide (TPR) repeat protein